MGGRKVGRDLRAFTQRCIFAPMKTAPQKPVPRIPNAKPEPPPRPRMTRALAEARAVGDPTKPKVDVVAFLRALKK